MAANKKAGRASRFTCSSPVGPDQKAPRSRVGKSSRKTVRRLANRSRLLTPYSSVCVRLAEMTCTVSWSRRLYSSKGALPSTSAAKARRRTRAVLSSSGQRQAAQPDPGRRKGLSSSHAAASPIHNHTNSSLVVNPKPKQKAASTR